MNVALIGYGKMGRLIEKVLEGRGHKVVLVVDAGDDFCSEKLRGVDVAIEFSTPETAFDNVCLCLQAGVAVVSGTTGWHHRLAEAQELCRLSGGAFFHASNYSLGVNLMVRLNRMLAGMMNHFDLYDVTVEETHHIQKKDAPSGTAIALASDIVDGLDRKRHWVMGPATLDGELGISSVRRSVVPGTHVVTYESECDVITLTHQAKSRDGFAQGAVAAAEFLCGRKGIFSMDDLFDNLNYK